jgi:hypothetical protein
MPESPSAYTPLTRLVLVMVCLAIAGSIGAGVHYYAVDLPQQKSVQPPDNGSKLFYQCVICKSNCEGKTDIYDCLNECDLVC